VWQEEQVSKCGGNRKHQEERRENPPNSPLVESRKGEVATPEMGCDYFGDEITRYDEEYVHADEATGTEKASVVQNDWDYGERPEAFDVSSVRR
jgi:hypothetical protein